LDAIPGKTRGETGEAGTQKDTDDAKASRWIQELTRKQEEVTAKTIGGRGHGEEFFVTGRDQGAKKTARAKKTQMHKEAAEGADDRDPPIWLRKGEKGVVGKLPEDVSPSGEEGLGSNRPL